MLNEQIATSRMHRIPIGGTSCSSPTDVLNRQLAVGEIDERRPGGRWLVESMPDEVARVWEHLGSLLEALREVEFAECRLTEDEMTRIGNVLDGVYNQLVQLSNVSKISSQGRACLQPPRRALSRKEVRVLSLASKGFSNEQLAKQLFVAETTVRTHLRNINGKLHTHSRTEAVAFARELGLIA